MKIKINLLVNAVCTILLAGCSGNKDSLPEVVRVARVTPYHIVAEGETVGSIAKEYKMTRSELIKLNKLQQPYQLYNGQKLIVSLKIEDEKAGKIDEDIVVREEKITPPQTQEPEKEIEKSEEHLEDSDNLKIIDKKEKTDTPASIKEEQHEAQLSYNWPIANAKNKISKHFGESDNGIEVDASVGTPVRAIADGTVKAAGVLEGGASAYGVTVIIKHEKEKKLSVSANLKEVSVKVGQRVKRGDKIGEVGKTGAKAKKPQLYFEVHDISKNARTPIDPEKLLSQDE